MPPDGHDPFTRTDPDQQYFDLQGHYEGVMEMTLCGNEIEVDVWLTLLAKVIDRIVASPYTVAEISRAWEERNAPDA